MHHLPLEGDQCANHDGDWGGAIEFSQPPTLTDCLDCLVACLRQRAISQIEDEGAGNNSRATMCLRRISTLYQIREALQDPEVEGDS